jgi:hypothetical protein
MHLENKYTTSEKLKSILEDKEVPQEIKGLEEKKMVLSNDAYAIGEMIDILIKKIDHARRAVTG